MSALRACPMLYPPPMVVKYIFLSFVQSAVNIGRLLDHARDDVASLQRLVVLIAILLLRRGIPTGIQYTVEILGASRRRYDWDCLLFVGKWLGGWRARSTFLSGFHFAVVRHDKCTQLAS